MMLMQNLLLEAGKGSVGRTPWSVYIIDVLGGKRSSAVHAQHSRAGITRGQLEADLADDYKSLCDTLHERLLLLQDLRTMQSTSQPRTRFENNFKQLSQEI